MKEFTSREISEFKRTAQNVWPVLAKKQKIEADIVAKQKELEEINKTIALKEAYVFSTTGCHVFDIIERVVTKTPVLNEDGSAKLDEKGKVVIATNVEFRLKYPDTIIPVDVTEELEVSPTAESVNVEDNGI